MEKGRETITFVHREGKAGDAVRVAAEGGKESSCIGCMLGAISDSIMCVYVERRARSRQCSV